MSVTVKCKCGVKFQAREADIRRGWAQSCSKSCAAIKREKKLDRNNYRGGGKPQGYYGETFNDAHLFSNEE